MIYPCNKCPDRQATCHDYCEKYLAVKREQDDAKAKKQAYHDAISILVIGTDRAKRKRHRRY